MAKRQAACTHCGRVFQVEEAQAGRRARCRGCDQSFVIAFAATAEAAPAPDELAAATEAPSVTQAAQLRGLRAEAVDLEQRRERAPAQQIGRRRRAAQLSRDLEDVDAQEVGAARDREAAQAAHDRGRQAGKLREGDRFVHGGFASLGLASLRFETTCACP